MIENKNTHDIVPGIILLESLEQADFQLGEHISQIAFLAVIKQYHEDNASLLNVSETADWIIWRLNDSVEASKEWQNQDLVTELISATEIEHHLEQAAKGHAKSEEFLAKSKKRLKVFYEKYSSTTTQE